MLYSSSSSVLADAVRFDISFSRFFKAAFEGCNPNASSS